MIASTNRKNYRNTTTRLNYKLKGFYNYYNVDTNIASIDNIYNYTVDQLKHHLKKHKIKTSAYAKDSNLPLAKPDYTKTKSL